MDAAEFSTGIVVDAYARLKSSSFDPAPYAAFVSSTGEPALELGCGDGEPMLSLRQAGLDVEGVDSSADMLDRYRANAAALGLQITLHHQRMEELNLRRQYRSIYLAGPTFTLLPDDKTAVRALRAIREHLTPDGQALIPAPRQSATSATQPSAQALCHQAGLTITRIEDDHGNPATPDADEFTLIVQPS